MFLKSNLFFRGFAFLFFIALSQNTLSQNAIVGVVSDLKGEPIVGANIIIKGTTEGVASDIDGHFTLRTELTLPLQILCSAIGFKSIEVEVLALQASIPIVLEEDVTELDGVVISASRRMEKVIEAPASVSVISARELAVSPIVNVTESLGSLPGVFIQKHTANSIAVELRGATDVLQTNTLPILDYRNLITPGVALFFSGGAGLSTIDLKRVEVVRGPASALYGPGVTSGVIHYFSKDPITYPGLAVELEAGEASTFNAQMRYASRLSEKFGVKVNANYRTGNEFKYDVNDPDDAAFLSQVSGQSVIEPGVSGGIISLNPADGHEIINNIDTDNDGYVLAEKYESFSTNVTLQYKKSKDLEINWVNGYNTYSEMFFSTSGVGLAQSNIFFSQLRSQYKGLFGQLSFNTDDGGTHKRPTYIYGADFASTLPLKRQYVEAQLQYVFDIESLNAEVTVGGDYRKVVSDSRNLVHGRAEDEDDYSILGGYVQSKFGLTEHLDFVTAVRLDDANLLDKILFSPRLALVYKATENHSIRGTFNRSVSAPNSIDTFIDIPAGLFDPNIPNAVLWLSGSNFSATFDDTSDIVFVNGLNPQSVTSTSLDIEDVYNAMQVASGNTLPNITPTGETALFGTYDGVTPLNGAVPFSQLPVDKKTVTSFELGYVGQLLNSKLKLNVDVYYNRETGLVSPQLISPFYTITPDFIADVATAISNAGGDPSDPAISQAIAAFAGTGVVGFAQSNAVPDFTSNGLATVHFGVNYMPDTFDYFGSDIGINYSFTKDISGYLNMTFISENEFDLPTAGKFMLNQPKSRYRVGAKYFPALGLNGSLAFQHTPSFEFQGGVLYSGTRDVQNVVDASLGYTLDNGFSFGVNATNLLGSDYRNAPNMPKQQRMVLAKVGYSLDFKK